MTTEVKPKKAVNSKKKGASFEGQIAKKLSEALAPLNFMRTAGSGARVGGVNVKFLERYAADIANIFIGDVCCINEEDNLKSRFSIECKFYKDVETLEQLFFSSKIPGWLEESRVDAQKTQRDHILIFKFNRTSTYAAIPENYTLPPTVTKCLNIHQLNIVLFDELIAHPDFWIIRK